MIKRNFIFLILIIIFIFVIYELRLYNSLQISVKVPQPCKAKIMLVSASATITFFSDAINFLDCKLSKIPSGKYKLKILLYVSNKVFAETKEIPLSFSYFTKIKVQYLKFDYIR